MKGANSTAQLVQAQHYDPWGGQLPGLGTLPASPNKYSYNGKEEQPMAGVYDYGARLYDGLTGRWGVVDPLAELSRRVSVYAMSYDNPLRFVDPDGRHPLDATKWAYNNGALEQYDVNSLRTTQRIGPSGNSGTSSSEGDEGGPGPKKKGATSQPGASQQASMVGAAALTGGTTEGFTAATLEQIVSTASSVGLSVGTFFTLMFTMTGDATQVKQPEGNGRIYLGAVPSSPPLRPLEHALIGLQLESGPVYWYHQTLTDKQFSSNGDQLGDFRMVSPRDLNKFRSRGMQEVQRQVSNEQFVGANAALGTLIQQGKTPYALFLNDCTTNCIQILRGAGYQPPTPATPFTLLNWFRATPR